MVREINKDTKDIISLLYIPMTIQDIHGVEFIFLALIFYIDLVFVAES